MIRPFLNILLFFLVFSGHACVGNEESENHPQFEAKWDSLDKRTLPSWYDDVKFGIFIHWGVYSVPAIGSEWFWKSWKSGSTYLDNFMKKNYRPNATYQEFAIDFTAEFFNATQWSEIFQASGAKYVVLTSKHHEGYTLWPSKYSFSWNALDVGPHRDLIGELANAIRTKTDLKFGLYHSLYEWFNPLYLYDQKNNYKTNIFVTNKVIPEMLELIESYKPEVLWSDGEWEASDVYWQSKEFLSWLYNFSPVKNTVVVNDRWGNETLCRHGDFYTCQDRFNPGVLKHHKWENCMTIDRRSWGFRRNARLADYMSLEELVKELVVTVSCNGNVLMNVGPTKDGIISPIFEERLRGIGAWLNVNGKAIYKTKPWKVQNDTVTGDAWYTQSKEDNTIYAIFLSWPKNNKLALGSVVNLTLSNINLLGYKYSIQWERKSSKIWFNLPLEAMKREPAWTLVLNQRF